MYPPSGSAAFDRPRAASVLVKVETVTPVERIQLMSAEELVKAHVAAHADIMAIPAAERQAAHARF